MNKEEYGLKLKDLVISHTNSVFALKREYALSNSIAKVNDIVEDYQGKILVKVVRVHFSDPPQCFYEGTVLLKSGAPSKNKERGTLQSNCESINGIEVKRATYG